MSASTEKLIVVTPLEGPDFFMLEENQQVDLLQIDEDVPIKNQKVKLLGSTFTELSWKSPVRMQSGITIYNTLTLYKKDKTMITFQRTEPSKTFSIPGNAYSYGNDTLYGYISFKKIDPIHFEFTTDMKTGREDNLGCNTSGTITYKKGIGYFEDILFDGSLGSCKAIFWFSEKQMQVFMLTDSYFCACPPETSISGVYTKE
ncbi:hypothetical protein QNI19_08605 [Cytophagaceae bacterium DM2B3-1]|uniref:Uncharacterized protein n=1 Tax=Xanthocytophaga flava TaxID=3048013 RepID=A0ABT7CGW6_9BACT|nr:hypothetical protein [Xanthocytophaga flavus]MDJ1492990.1 hypothetical protein [Xanthocytophaga flavus]